MPHVVYVAASILCPWSGCSQRLALIDFQLELMNDPALYAQVVASWGSVPDFGVVAKCPGCGQYVRFGANDKQAVSDPVAAGLPVLPDDWHMRAIIF